MADDPLRELLSSPLDDARGRFRVGATEPKQPRPKRSAAGTTGPWLVGSMALGAFIAIAGYLIARDDGATVSTAETTATTTTVAVIDPIGILPNGYTPVGDRLGMKVERVLIRSDSAFVSLSTVVPNTLAPAESSGYEGGLWNLILTGGRRVASVRESTDAEAPGFVSVEFPAGSYVESDIVAVELRGVARHESQEVTTESTASFTLPTDGSTITVGIANPQVILDAGVDVVFSDLSISTAQAEMSWTLAGTDPDAGATVYAGLVLDAGGPLTEAAVLRSYNPSFGFFRGGSIGTTPPLREGTMVFDPSSAPTFSADVAMTARFTFQVDWTVYEPTSTTIPIGDETVITRVG